jgi:hypothetical protein
MVAEGLLSGTRQDIQEQARGTSAGRPTRRYHFPHKIPATQTKVKGQSQQTYKVCMDRGKNKTEGAVKKLMTVCWKCDVKLCLWDHFKNYCWETNYYE